MKKGLALFFVIAALLLTSACGAEREAASTGGTGGGGGGTGSGSGPQVVASDFSFSPSELELEPGEEVELTLKNEDSATHSFTSDELGVDIEAEGGASTSTNLTAPDSGSAEWHCRFHSQMTGEISVGQGGTEGGQTESEDDGGTEGGQTESEDDGGAY